MLAVWFSHEKYTKLITRCRHEINTKLHIFINFITNILSGYKKKFYATYLKLINKKIYTKPLAAGAARRFRLTS